MKLVKARPTNIVEKIKSENLLSRPLKRKRTEKPSVRKKVKSEEASKEQADKTSTLVVVKKET